YRNFSYSEEVEMNKKLKIAMFTNNYFPVIGGVPISIERLSRALRKLGHEVKIFAPKYPDFDKDEADIIRCSLLYYHKQGGMDIPITNIFSRKIENEFYKNDFDVVHCHHPFWLGSKGMSLGHKYNVPVVFTYHTRLEKYAHYIPGFLFLRKLFENRFAHLMIKHFSNRANAVFTPTDSTREYLRAVGVKRFIKVLPTGVDFDNYDIDKDAISSLRSELAGEEILLITVARLSKEKNLYFLLDGIKYIKENSDLNFRLIVLGDGPERNNLQDYLKENNLDNSVDLLGSVDFKEISRYYLASDLFVFASTSETQGMVLLEAMAGNTPVVAVRSSGIDDVIENGFNGYKTEEDVESWAEKVMKLMKDDELLAETSENALKMAQKYSIMNMGEEAEKVYKKLLK
ncbi:MAG: glycosyltransferase, partial [Bacillota bacterium]